VARTCALSVWKHQKDEWKKIVTQTDRDMELFKDILGIYLLTAVINVL
jgi:hypothetical protein